MLAVRVRPPVPILHRATGSSFQWGLDDSISKIASGLAGQPSTFIAIAIRRSFAELAERDPRSVYVGGSSMVEPRSVKPVTRDRYPSATPCAYRLAV